MHTSPNIFEASAVLHGNRYYAPVVLQIHDLEPPGIFFMSQLAENVNCAYADVLVADRRSNVTPTGLIGVVSRMATLSMVQRLDPKSLPTDLDANPKAVYWQRTESGLWESTIAMYQKMSLI